MSKKFCFCFVWVLVITFVYSANANAESYTAAVLADSPTAWWRLGDDIGATVAAEEISGFDGTVGQTVTFGDVSVLTDGDTAAVFQSDADGVITVSDDILGLDNALDFGTDGDFTIEGWFKRPSSGAATGGIVNKGDTNASLWVLSWASGEVGFLLDYGSTSDLAKSTAKFNDDQWHHFAAVADRDVAIQLYVDGTKVAEDTDLAGGDISNDMTFDIGIMGTLSLNGSLDEIAVYDYALSETRIQAHIDAATAVVPEPSSLALLLCVVLWGCMHRSKASFAQNR